MIIQQFLPDKFDAIYGAMVGGGVAMLVNFFTNRNSRKMLSLQLTHQATQRENLPMICSQARQGWQLCRNVRAQNIQLRRSGILNCTDDAAPTELLIQRNAGTINMSRRWRW
jgi:hypothetical protein